MFCVYTVSLNFHSNRKEWFILLPLLYRWGKGGSEGLIKLLKVTQLANSRDPQSNCLRPPRRLDRSASSLVQGAPANPRDRRGGPAGSGGRPRPHASAAHALSGSRSGRAAGARTAARSVRAVTCRAPCWRAGGSGSGRCSLSRSRSLARFPQLPSVPPPNRLRAGVCAREGEGVGGVGGGLPVPGRPAEGGGGCEGLREAMDVERLQEALKGGGSCPLSLPPYPPWPPLRSLLGE